MIELESYMAPIPTSRNSGAGPRGTGKTVPWQSPKTKSIKILDVIRRGSVVYGSLLCWRI